MKKEPSFKGSPFSELIDNWLSTEQGTWIQENSSTSLVCTVRKRFLEVITAWEIRVTLTEPEITMFLLRWGNPQDDISRSIGFDAVGYDIEVLTETIPSQKSKL